MAPHPASRAALVLVLFASIVLGSLAFVAPPARAGAAIVFSEDFEDGVIGAQWSATDATAASGLDYWGITDYRAHGGTYSAWSAQVGNQSSGAFVGLNNSDPGVQYYDDNMDAELVILLQVSGYNGLTLSFFTFTKTENGGGDWIQVWIGAGSTVTLIYDNRGSTGQSWENVTAAVPTDIDRLIFRFHTDTANHAFEGAYIDDIVLVGTEDVPPTSSVSSLPVYSNDAPFEVPYAADDGVNASGVDYVELWYRQGTSGNFTLYTGPANPFGRWISPTIPFDASLAAGDGYYEFYTIAVDRAGNPEDAPNSPDASVTIDTTRPTLTIISPASGAEFGDGSVSIEWQASDGLSGIDRYEVSLDGGTFQSTGTTPSTSFSGLAAGQHTIVVRAYDRAGNLAEQSVTVSIVASAPAPLPWWIVLLIVAILLGGLVLLLWWKRRKGRSETREALRTLERRPQDMAVEAGAGPEEIGPGGPP